MSPATSIAWPRRAAIHLRTWGGTTRELLDQAHERGLELQAGWTLRRESEDKRQGGDRETVPAAQDLSILEEKSEGILFRAPSTSGPGGYSSN